MGILLLAGAIVILGIWTVWQEYRITKIREELNHTNGKLARHNLALYGEWADPLPFYSGRDARRRNGVLYRLGAIERKLRTAEDRERVEHRKAEMKEHIFNNDTTRIEDADKLINELYNMAHGFSTAETECEEEDE